MIRQSTTAAVRATAVRATAVRTTAGSGPEFAPPTGSERGVARRRGYTLIEMLIVCAVLAAIAGMSWPAMRGVLSKGRLRKGADDIETTIRKARIRAIRDGRTFVLRYEPGGRRYRVESWETMARSGDRDSAGPESLVTDEQQDGSPIGFEPITEELPAGVRFLPVGFASDGMDLTPDLTPGEPSDALAELNWSEPIIFQANGRSENAAIRLIDDRRFVIDVTLRGLTGVVSSTLPVRFRAEQDQRLEASDDLFGSSESGATEDLAAHGGRS